MIKKKKKKKPEDSGPEPRRMQAIWGNIPQNTASSLWGPSAGDAVCLYLTYINCHPAAVGVQPNTMEYPDGLNKANKCSLLLKAVYISFQGFEVLRSVVRTASYRVLWLTFPHPVETKWDSNLGGRMVSTRAVTAGSLSDLPPILFYWWSIAAVPQTQWAPADPPAGGGGRAGWTGGSLPALPSGPLGLLAPRWGCLGRDCFCFLPPRCSDIRPCPTGD